MIKKLSLMAAAVAAFAAAAGVCVVSLAYAIFALVRIWLTPPASAAVVTLVFAVAIGVGALLLNRKTHTRQMEMQPGPLERLTELARRKPLIAAAAAVVGSFVALRNPGVAATMVMGLMAPKPPERRR